VSDGDEIRLGDRAVGQVGTAVLSPAHGPIALAIVRREAEPGARVEIGDAAVGAEVVEPPF
jgi:folate-binding Fe-S cluster repair protein YgfZ